MCSQSMHMYSCSFAMYLFHVPPLFTGIDQYDRDSIINDFKSGACRLMVATSVAARGLDVKQLILVVNYNCPNHYEDYVHRAGRTGRAGNKVGCQGNKLNWIFEVKKKVTYIYDFFTLIWLLSQYL